MEIKIDIDKAKLQLASDSERQNFQTALFCAASQATADFGASVDFSDPLHWIITVPDQYAEQTRKLLNC